MENNIDNNADFIIQKTEQKTQKTKNKTYVYGECISVYRKETIQIQTLKNESKYNTGTYEMTLYDSNETGNEMWQ